MSHPVNEHVQDSPVSAANESADHSAEVSAGEPVAAKKRGGVGRWGGRLAIVTFSFFLIKGLLWLTVPVLLATGLFTCGRTPTSTTTEIPAPVATQP